MSLGNIRSHIDTRLPLVSLKCTYNSKETFISLKRILLPNNCTILAFNVSKMEKFEIRYIYRVAMADG